MTSLMATRSTATNISRFVVNRCVEARVTDAELEAAYDPLNLIWRTVAPLVWLSMPVHDQRGEG